MSIAEQMGKSGAFQFSNLPEAMKPVVKNITDLATTYQACYFFEIDLYNKKNQISYEVPAINSIELVQEFESSIGDMIEMDIQVSEQTRQNIMDDYKNMVCRLKSYLYDPTSGSKVPCDDMSLEWNIIIAERSNMSRFILPKEQTAGAGQTTNKSRLLNMTISLYDPALLAMKTKKTSGIFRDCTLANLIGFLAYTFGAKFLDLTPPHNLTVIENLYIEPLHYINDIFDYLQFKFGIYRQGVSIYFTGNHSGLPVDDAMLYVYPKYDYAPILKLDQAIEIYFIGQKSIPNGSMSYRDYGLNSVITYNDKPVTVSGVKVLCNDVKSCIPLSETGADKIGTISIMYNANRTIDRWRYIKEDKTLAVPIINDDVLDGMKPDVDFRGFVAAQYNPRYDVSYNNAYRPAEILASVSCEVMVLHLSGVKPWLFKPGQLIYFCYSNRDPVNMTKVPGIISSIQYSFTKIKTAIPGANTFQCDAMVTLKLRLAS